MTRERKTTEKLIVKRNRNLSFRSPVMVDECLTWGGVRYWLWQFTTTPTISLALSRNELASFEHLTSSELAVLLSSSWFSCCGNGDENEWLLGGSSLESNVITDLHRKVVRDVISFVLSSPNMNYPVAFIQSWLWLRKAFLPIQFISFPSSISFYYHQLTITIITNPAFSPSFHISRHNATSFNSLTMSSIR